MRPFRPVARSSGRSSKPVAMLALDLPLDVAVTNLPAPVTLLLAAGEGQLDLGVRPLEVDPRRDQGQPAALAATDESLDLVAVKEQLAGALRIVVLVRGGRVRRD